MGRVNSNISQAYLQTLLAGDRSAARKVIDTAVQQHNHTTRELLTDLVWPTMELMQELFRDDRISVSNLNLGTRLNRSISDQLCASLSKGESNGKKVLIFCGDDEPEELGGQICSEMFESDGWTVKFAGGGVPEDEVLNLFGRERPDLLVMFGTLPSGVPGVRKLIDYLREVNSCPQMQIMCCGGIYKRAEGLAEEIGADLYAPDAATAVTVARDNPDRKACSEQQTVGRSRRVRRPMSQRIAPASNGQNVTNTSNSSSSTTML
jgi:methanogenic corrinoid protein MtbC1